MGARPFEAYRQRRLGQLDIVYASRLEAGFPVTFEGNAEALQVSRDEDRTNWLTLLGMCSEAEAAGLGDDPVPLPIRCTSNATYTVSFTEAAEIIRSLRAWCAAAMGNLWRLKDEIRACGTRDGLLDINLEEGWP